MDSLVAPDQLTRLFDDPAFAWVISHFSDCQKQAYSALEGCSSEKEMFKLQGSLQVYRKITDQGLRLRMMEELQKQWTIKQTTTNK